MGARPIQGLSIIDVVLRVKLLSGSTNSIHPIFGSCFLLGISWRISGPIIKCFAMTSLGATIDESVNLGRGPYVFKVSGQIYYRIGRLCPEDDTDPRFLKLYIYDTDHEVDNRLSHFTNTDTTNLRREIVEGLIRVLDGHDALVQVFRTARDEVHEVDVPEFKVRLYGVVGSAQHELPTADCIGAIVFEDGPQSESEYDIVIERHSGEPESD